MAVRGIDDDEIDAGLDERFAPRIAGLADRGCGRHAQPALLVLAGVRIGHRFFDIFDGDQADAAILGVDHQQLLDAVLVQKLLGFLLIDIFADRDQSVLGHQFGNLLPRVGGEAHVAIGENADELARTFALAVAAALDNRNAGNAIFLHQRQRFGERRLRVNGDRIHHHAGFEFLHLPHLRGLCVRLEIAVDDTDAAGLRHGNRHGGFADRIHGGSDDRDIEQDIARDPRADVDLRRHDVGQAGLQ